MIYAPSKNPKNGCCRPLPNEPFTPNWWLKMQNQTVYSIYPQRTLHELKVRDGALMFTIEFSTMCTTMYTKNRTHLMVNKFKLDSYKSGETKEAITRTLAIANNYAGELSIEVLPLDKIELDP